jgi:hypothetical protein
MFVMFNAPYSIDSESELPGCELAQTLADRLSSKGFTVLDVVAERPTHWKVELSVDGEHPFVAVYPEASDYQNWGVNVDSGVPFFTRLFGRNDLLQRERIALALQEILIAHPDLTDIKWHDGSFDWETATDTPD